MLALTWLISTFLAKAPTLLTSVKGLVCEIILCLRTWSWRDCSFSNGKWLAWILLRDYATSWLTIEGFRTGPGLWGFLTLAGSLSSSRDGFSSSTEEVMLSYACSWSLPTVLEVIIIVPSLCTIGKLSKYLRGGSQLIFLSSSSFLGISSTGALIDSSEMLWSLAWVELLYRA